MPERDRPERGCAVVEAHRHRDAALALDLRPAAEQRQQSDGHVLLPAARARAPSPGTARSIALSAGATRSRLSGDALLLPMAGKKLLEPRNIELQARRRAGPPASAPSVPVAVASVSPCAMRALWISSRPPAACQSRKRTGSGFTAKSFMPCSTASDDRRRAARARQRLERRRARGLEIDGEIDRRIVRPGAELHARMKLGVLGVEQRRARRRAVELQIVDHDRGAVRRRRACRARSPAPASRSRSYGAAGPGRLP